MRDSDETPGSGLLPAPVPITVVIPVRNSAGQLRLCLEALLRNSLEAVEILVVDDASTDDTCQTAASIGRMSSAPFRCLRMPHQSGPAAARNEGMRQAGSPYVFFVDADIVLPARTIDWIRETLAAHSGRPEVIGVMGVYAETIPWPEFISNFKNVYVCFLHKTTPTVSPYLHTPILCMRRTILDAAGGFDTGLATAEDFRLGLQLGSRGYRFIIDRRIQGTHLKRLDFRGLLREDARRIRDLLSIQMEKEHQKISTRAHRMGRLLSVILPGPLLALSFAAVKVPVLAWPAAAGWTAFYLCNLDFIRYVFDRKGFGFGLKSAAFLFIEMLWAQLALAYWAARRIASGRKNGGI